MLYPFLYIVYSLSNHLVVMLLNNYLNQNLNSYKEYKRMAYVSFLELKLYYYLLLVMIHIHLVDLFFLLLYLGMVKKY